MGAAGLLVVGYFLVRGLTAPSAPAKVEVELTPPPVPGEALVDGVDGLAAGEGMHVQFTDPDDPSTVTGELFSASIEPLESRRYIVEQPVMWLYEEDGRTLMVRAAKGRLYMPSRSQEPESGTLEGDVTVHVYEAQEDGTYVRSESDVEPELVAKTESLFFDMALGEMSTEDWLSIETEELSFKGRGIRARMDEVSRRLVLLEVLESDHLSFDPSVRRRASTPDEEGAGAPSPPAPRPDRPRTPPTTVAETTPGAGEAAPRRGAQGAAAEAPTVTLYQATFDDDVVLAQGDRSLNADLLEIWVRLIDGKLPEGAIADVRFESVARRSPSGGGLFAGLAPYAAALALAAQPEAQPDGEASPDEVVTLRWSGPIRVVPVESARELERDDLTVRFSSVAQGGLHLADAASGATGAAELIEYGATSRRALMRGRPGSPAWVDSPEYGRLEFDGADADLANGLVHIEGRCVATGADDSGSIACTHGADLALHMVDGALIGVLREAVFNGQVVASNGDARATGETARGTFSLETGEGEATFGRLEHFHLEGGRSAPARLAQGEDESLEGRVIDVALVEGPDGQLDPSRVEVVDDVVGRQGDSLLVAGSLTADLARDDEGELVVTSAHALDAIRFTREGDEIEAVADELVSEPALEKVTLIGDGAFVRRGTGSVHGRQIALDGISRTIDVFGAGRFDDREGTGTTASWTREMRFNDSTGLLECHGDVEARMEPDELSVDTISAYRLTARLTEGTADASLLEVDGSMEELMGERGLLSALAIGSIEELEDGSPAVVQSIRYEIQAGPDGEPARVPLQAMMLEGPRIEVGREGRRLDVPAAGRLVVADDREPDPEAASESVRGQAMFTWEGSLSFDRELGEAEMRRTVELTMLEPARSRVTLLDAERVVARFGEEEGSAAARLTGATAQGAVYLEQKADGVVAFEVIADSLELDNAAQTAEASASEGNVVTVFEGTRPAPVTATRIFFDLAKGRWEVRNPGAVTSPK